MLKLQRDVMNKIAKLRIREVNNFLVMLFVILLFWVNLGNLMTFNSKDILYNILELRVSLSD